MPLLGRAAQIRQALMKTSNCRFNILMVYLPTRPPKRLLADVDLECKAAAFKDFLYPGYVFTAFE
jgi:hypothetical protein